MRRVLFADEDEEFLVGIRRALSTSTDESVLGLSMSFVTDSDAALAELADGEYDVVITDLRTPGPSGAGLVGAVRERHPRTARVVLASPRVDDGDFFSVLNAAHQFLEKPCPPDRLEAAILRALTLHDQLSEDDARVRVDAIDVLPSPSAAVHELLLILDDPYAAATDAAQVIEQDVGLAAKVLRFVNSAFFGAGREVADVAEAVTRLGTRNVRSLVVMTSINRAFADTVEIPPVWLERLSRHALEVARLASVLVQDRSMTADAFCAGLLHETGLLVMAAARPQVFDVHLDRHARAEASIGSMEREAFGVDHGRAGSYLLDLWEMPKSVVDTCLVHDQLPDRPGFIGVVEAVQIAHHAVEWEFGAVCGAVRRDAEVRAQLDAAGVLENIDMWRATIGGGVVA